MGIFSLGEILKETGIAAVVATALDALKNGAKKSVEEAGAVATKRIAKKLNEEHRKEFFAFLRALAAEDLTASENLFRHWRDRQHSQPRTYGLKEPYKDGDEAKFEDLLGGLYVALSDEDEVETRREVFKWLGHLEDPEFDETLPLLDHDIVIQWLKKTGAGIRQAATWLRTNAANSAAQVLEGINTDLRDWLNTRRAARGLRRI